MIGLTGRFDAIMQRMHQTMERTGRKNVQLVAISKMHKAEELAELAGHWSGCGLPVFGESYMQEARDKMAAVGELLQNNTGVVPQWHFVGHIQSKKAKDIIGRFDLIHSVDSLKLAEALQKAWQTRVDGAARAMDAPPPAPQRILVQVNVGRESQKSGVDPDNLEDLLRGIAAMPELTPQGLMCLPPLAEIGEHSRPYFVLLRALRDKMEQRLGLALPHLSMGMSDDFEAAIEEGATLVRIGTDIFGPRTL